MQRLVGRGADVAHGEAAIAAIDGVAQRGADSDFGGDAGKDERFDRAGGEVLLQTGAGEGAVTGFVDNQLVLQRFEFIDEIMTVLATYQQPSERADRADCRACAAAALALPGRTVGLIRRMAFAGVDDHHTGCASGS